MAAVGLAPRLLAKPEASAKAAVPAATVNLRPESRAVPREAGSV
jgi:hypothetical protein